jgi:eukaryotic-like serine/threonine-protein kinase
MAKAQTTGRRFGRYRLIRRLARGGMAEIYRANYEGAAGIKKQVVVKKILPSFADNKRFVQMFIDEAKITVGLSHGNIAQVFDFGEIGGEYFLAMEYIQGQSLSRIHRRADERGLIVPVPIACYVVMEMCKGLHYAHRKTDEHGQPLGIVHRDISPQNVMVSFEGQVKLVDFGIAKARNVAGNTQAGALKGKYLYFSPEQARGRPLDGRSDVFAAGIVLYELLTGELPYHGQLVDVLTNIVEGRFARPSDLVPTIPPSLERIILKAMTVRLEDRYQTALELQEALAAFLYSVAPRFTSANLAYYIQYLFADELTSQGLSVDFPAEFLEQLPLWQRQVEAPRPPPQHSTEDTDAELVTGSDSDTGWERPSTKTSTGRPAISPAEAARRKKLMRTVGIVGAALGVMAIVAGAVISATQNLAPSKPGAGLVAIDSTPAGARIEIDGADTGQVTPSVFEHLVPGRSYGLTLRLEGHTAAMRTMTPSADGVTSISVPLEAQQVVRPRPRLSDVEAQLRRERGDPADGRPQPEPSRASIGSSLEMLAAETGMIGDTGNQVIEGALRLDRAVVDVNRLPTAKLELTPDRPHTLTVHGSAYLGNPLLSPSFSEVLYLAVRRRGENEFGVLRAGTPVYLEDGVTTVHLVVADFDPSDNEGQLMVRARADDGSAVETDVDAKDNAFDPRRHGALVLTGMQELRGYRIETTGAGSPRPLLYTQGTQLKGWTSGRLTSPPMGMVREGDTLRGVREVAFFSLRAAGRPPQGRLTLALHPH